METSGIMDKSLEAVELENEIEVYTDKLNLDVVKGRATDMEGQEQFGLFVESSGSKKRALKMRVRRTRKEDDIDYEFTIKHKDDQGQNTEINLDIDESTYREFKKLTDNGMVKTRYKVPVSINTSEGDVDTFFEVDVFPKSEWVKIDIELPKGTSANRSAILEALSTIDLKESDVLIVTPIDKINGTKDALRASEIIQKECVTHL